MAEIPITQQARSKSPDKEECARPGIMTAIRPGTVITAPAGDSVLFTYFPRGMGNDQPGCSLFTGIEIKTIAKIQADEFQILIKTTIDSFPEIKDESTLLKLEKTIESVYNDIHPDQAMKIDSIRVVMHDPSADELRYHVMYVDCPSCHKRTKVVLTWDAVQARSQNPNAVANMLFKKDKTECGHSFIAFLDKALKVRGCELLDM